MQQEEAHREFVISWMDPPMTSLGWEMGVAPANVAAKSRLEQAVSSRGSYVLRHAPSKEAGLANAKAFIDSMYS